MLPTYILRTCHLGHTILSTHNIFSFYKHSTLRNIITVYSKLLNAFPTYNSSWYTELWCRFDTWAIKEFKTLWYTQQLKKRHSYFHLGHTKQPWITFFPEYIKSCVQSSWKQFHKCKGLFFQNTINLVYKVLENSSTDAKDQPPLQYKCIFITMITSFSLFNSLKVPAKLYAS